MPPTTGEPSQQKKGQRSCRVGRRTSMGYLGSNLEEEVVLDISNRLAVSHCKEERGWRAGTLDATTAAACDDAVGAI